MDPTDPRQGVGSPSRLRAVRATELLDTPPEESFDRLTRAAVRLLDVPVAFVSIVDAHRDFYKSSCGFGEPLATLRELSGTTFCHYALASEGPLVIPDTRADPVYREVPTVESLGAAAYAGVPIRIDGEAIGSFCAIDFQPRAWTEREVELLVELSHSAQREIELRRAVRDVEMEQSRLRELVRLSPASIAVLDGPEHVFSLVNDAFRQLVGPRELLGRPLREALPEAEEQGLPEALDRVIRSGRTEVLPETDGWVRLETNGAKEAKEAPRLRVVLQPMYAPDASVGGVLIHGVDVTEQVRARREVEREAADRAAILDQLATGVLMADPHGRVVFANQAAWRIHGQDPQKDPSLLLARLEFFTPGGDPVPRREMPLMRAIQRRERIDSFEFLARQADGHEVLIRGHASPVFREDGSLLGAVGSFRDVTRVREMELEYQLQHHAMEAVADSITIADATQPDLPMVYANPGFQRITGYTREEALGRNLRFLQGPGTDREAVRRLREALRREEPITEVLLNYRRDGTPFWSQMSITPVRDAEGRVTHFVGLQQDVSQRLESEIALRESEERFRQIADNLDQVIWMTSADGTQLLYVSPAFERVWGRPIEEFRSDFRSRWDVVVEEDRARVLEAFAPGGAAERTDITYRIRRPDGEIRWISSRRLPVRNEQGEVYRIAGFAEDVTQQRMLEEQLRQSQKMEAIGQLAGGVAHDFNNILTVIKAYCFMLLESLPRLDPIREDIQEIDRSADRAASLTRQLLAFSRRQVLRPQVVQPNRAVEGLQRMLERLIGEDVELVTRLDPSLETVEVDPGQLEQAIVNLVVNARDAMPQGGVIVISSENLSLDRTVRRANYTIPAGRYVAVRVRDTGHGIPEAIRDRIFEPFFTTKPAGAGTGLGLSTVYGIVKQSGGFVEIAPDEGPGTEFAILLPAVGSPESGSPATETATQAPPSPHATVLLVEDERAVRSLLTLVMKRGGFDVLSAASPSEALRLAAEGGARPDVLVTDVVLPEMGGPALAEAILELIPDLRVIFMSGYTDEAIARQGVLRSDAPLLEKPFTPDLLLDTLRQVLV